MPIERLKNLKIHLFDDEGAEITTDLYGKVTRIVSKDPFVMMVQFTSVPPEATAFFRYRYNF